jgi:hypothetical protein
MTITVFQAVLGIVLLVVGLTGKPAVQLGKFRSRPMTQLGQSIVFGTLGAVLFLPAALLIVGREANLARLQHLGLALDTEASFLMMWVGGLFLYMGIAAKKLYGGNQSVLRMFRISTVAAGSILLATNAYLIRLRLHS